MSRLESRSRSGAPGIFFSEIVGGMKLPILASIILAGSLAHAGSIVQKRLDEFTIYDIPVASNTGTTTVMFPSEISGLFAKSVAVQDQENAGVLISFTLGGSESYRNESSRSWIKPRPIRFC